MSQIFVQFTNSSDEVILSCFGSPQEGDSWPNQGTVDNSDPRWVVFYNEQSILFQRILPTPENP